MHKYLSALFTNWFRRNAVELDLDDELRATVDILAEEKMKPGLSAAAARREALIILGGVEQVKEEVTAVRIGHLFDDFSKDVRYGLRTLRRDRVFATAAIITIALGIGALTSVFSIFNAALLQPLPYEGSHRLVAITDRGVPYTVSYPYYQRLRERGHVFAELGLYLIERGELTIGESRESVNTARVTASLLQAAKTTAIHGRVFSQEEDRLGGQDLAVIGISFWRNRLGGHEDVLGKQISIDGIPHTILGILPNSYTFPASGIEVWTPFHVKYGSLVNSPQSRVFQMAASLRPGFTIAQAQREVSSIVSKTDKEFPDLPPSLPALVTFYRDYVVGNFRPAYSILLIAGCFVMAIACANVTNLFLIQAEKGRREMAVKVALGASNRRILSEQIVKSLLVMAAGSTLGVVLAWWSIAYMRVLARQKIPRLAEATMGLGGLSFAVGLCVTAAAVVTIFSLARPSSVSPAAYLSVSSMVWTPKRTGIRHLYVIIEFALALVLMIGAGLMIRSLQNLLNIGLGFKPQNVLTLYPKLPDSTLRDDVRPIQFCKRLAESLRGLPGVLAVGATSNLPFGERLSQVLPVTVDRNQNMDGELTSIQFIVSPGYFEAMGIPIVKGRAFTESDCNPKAEQVAIIDQTLARRFWPKDDPIGQSFFEAVNQAYRPRIEAPPPTKWLPLTVVGVVPGVTRHSLKTYLDHDPNAGWYEIGQYYRPWGTWSGLYTYLGDLFAIHTQGDPTQLADAVRREVHLLDVAVVPSEFSTMEDSWLDYSAERRFYMVILNIFGFNALVLAAVGIYGVAAFSVTQRTHEIGVRIALGAKDSQICSLVAVDGLRLVGIGGAIGACAGLALSRFLGSMLFEVSEKDVATFMISMAVLVVAASIACYLPARRATRLDPWTVLRVE